MAYLNRYPGGQDLVARLMALQRQAQITGQVNPDMAPIVAESLAGQREKNYRDAMLALQEQAGTLSERKQAAQESQFAKELEQRGGQFADTLALNRSITDQQIAQANRMRNLDWLNTGLGAALSGGYLALKKWRS